MNGKLIALAAVVVLVALAAFAEWTLQIVPFERHDVAMPAVTATPQQVVAAYVEALDVHDCDSAQQPWLSDKTDPRMWCSPSAASASSAHRALSSMRTSNK